MKLTGENYMVGLISNVGESIKFGWSVNAKRIGRWIILLIFSIIPIVNFIAEGAFMKIFNGEEPEFKGNVGSCFIRGLLAFVAGLIYCIIPGIIGGIICVFNATAGAVVGSILGILAALLFMPGFAAFARGGKFGSFFKFGDIFASIGKLGWGKYILAWIVLFIVCFILGILCAIPLVGIIIAILLFLLTPVLESALIKYWANLLE